MTFDEYPGAEPPDVEVCCPRCGRLWQGWCTADRKIEWACADGGALCLRARAPVRTDRCEACAWEMRTLQEEWDYAVQEVGAERLLSYALRGEDRDGLSKTVSEIFFGALLTAEPDYACELMDDFISDCRRDDFIDWAMDAAPQKRSGGTASGA